MKVESFFVFLRKNTKTMKKILFIVCCLLFVSFLTGCKKKKDAAYYMEMVDSIRKAETVKDIQKKAGIYDNPVDAWFDTLAIHTLPIKSAGSDIGLIGHFVPVPMTINENFGYPVSAHLTSTSPSTSCVSTNRRMKTVRRTLARPPWSIISPRNTKSHSSPSTSRTMKNKSPSCSTPAATSSTAMPSSKKQSSS